MTAPGDGFPSPTRKSQNLELSDDGPSVLSVHSSASPIMESGRIKIHPRPQTRNRAVRCAGAGLRETGAAGGGLRGPPARRREPKAPTGLRDADWSRQCSPDGLRKRQMFAGRVCANWNSPIAVRCWVTCRVIDVVEESGAVEPLDCGIRALESWVAESRPSSRIIDPRQLNPFSLILTPFHISRLLSSIS